MIKNDPSLLVGEVRYMLMALSLPKVLYQSVGVGSTTAWRVETFDVLYNDSDNKQEEWGSLRHPIPMHIIISMEVGDSDVRADHYCRRGTPTKKMMK